MNSLIEQIETWITNLIDQRIANEIALAKPKNIEEISEARVIELINGCFNSFDINDYLDISDFEDEIRECHYTAMESFDINDYLDISDFEDEIREIVNNTFETKSIDILIPQ
jgi:hypothetical protein